LGSKESEEVSTLIETALTSRRLRNYDIAISLLIRARRRWGAIAAGREVPGAWAEYQPVESVPSPWDIHEVPAPLDGNADAQDPCIASGSPPPEEPDSDFDMPIGPSDLLRDARELFDAAREMQRVDSAYTMSRKSSQEQTRESDVPRGCSRAGTASMDSTTVRLPRKMTKTPNSARGVPSSNLGGNVGLGATVGGSERVYDPHLHFATACGEDDENLRYLAAEVHIFFLCELASLHSAIHEDEMAAQLLWGALPYSERLPSNHPDTAVVWCGIGRVTFHIGSYDIAARAMARARRIRERTIGENTVETATTYNNLACCLTSLDRPLEAVALLELASELLKVLLGCDHPRTQTAVRNFEKARSSHKHIHCEVPHLFGIPVMDKWKLVKKVRKTRKKKVQR